MTGVFADTSFFVAMLRSKDALHLKAIELFSNYRGTVYTTSWVLAETGNFFALVPTRSAFTRLTKMLRTSLDVVVIPPTEDDFDSGLNLYLSRSDKGWSLVDCISFQKMRDYGLTDAWTAAHHFIQAGFKALLLQP